MSDSGKLPIDCCHHVFSFLELIDCLHFASTSSTAMREMLPTLRGRRNRMLKPYAVVVRKTMTSRKSTYRTEIGALDELCHIDSGIECAHRFPTLQERAAQLATKIPRGYPSFELIQELNQHLLCFSRHPEFDVCEETSLSPAALIESQRQFVLPLKIHAIILNNALLSKHGDNATTTEFHNYIGDVFCVTFLFYDFGRNSQYAEGSLSPRRMEETLRQFPPTCYQSWVLMHASILRTKQFTERQQSRLGLLNIHFGSSPLADAEKDKGIIQSAFISPQLTHSGWNIAVDKVRTDQFMKSEMCLVYDDFGPLGPSFRGRDIVRVRDVTADALQECLIYHNAPYGGGNSRDALEWICIAHEQAYQSRPMSVRQPVVRFG
jgi:hypothetical protein